MTTKGAKTQVASKGQALHPLNRRPGREGRLVACRSSRTREVSSNLVGGGKIRCAIYTRKSSEEGGASLRAGPPYGLRG